MDVKECTRCGEVKPLSDYCKSSRHRMGVQPACKSCMNIAYNTSRAKKQKHYNQLRKERSAVYHQQYREWKSKQKCLLCPESSINCLDLHHLDPNEKDGTVSDMAYNRPFETLLEEINKCVVLCSNCHRKLHAGEFSLLGD